MWPFSKKKETPQKDTEVPLRTALAECEQAGVRKRAGVSDEDLLYSTGGTMDSPTSLLSALCLLGSEVERGNFERVSDDIWHFDSECIYDHGNYAELIERFVVLAKGALPLTEVADFVDTDAGTAWVEFSLDGKKFHWDLEVNDDWVDPSLYARLQDLVIPRASGKRFFMVALGQDSLISFGDEKMKERLSQLSGLKFAWE